MKTLNRIILVNVLFILIMVILFTIILLIDIKNAVVMYICFTATSVILYKYADWVEKVAILKLKDNKLYRKNLINDAVDILLNTFFFGRVCVYANMVMYVAFNIITAKHNIEMIANNVVGVVIYAIIFYAINVVNAVSFVILINPDNIRRLRVNYDG